jgi:predicted metal-dependent hydrolase
MFYMDIEFQGYKVKIKRRAFYRRMSLKVNFSGTISVTVGKLITQNQINKFLLENHNWIDGIQKKYKDSREKFPQKKIEEGELYSYLGQDVVLKIEIGEFKVLKFVFYANQIRCQQPQHKVFQKSDYKRALLRCYEKAGRRWLQHRLDYWSENMGLYPKKVSVRAQRTRWGSCTSEGSISLNWKLLAAPLPVLDYVVIHELAHLKHPNHSKDFWALVKNYDPNYKYHRKWLKDNFFLFEFLNKN